MVVDVGINRDDDGKLCGDCWNFNEEKHKNLKVTPVPGGVGLLTRAMLMLNTLEAMKNQQSL
jgi:methylenetetrahydrofolate dehydrogenase (NADP+)/methenyltetrahydrofolate cyclohydrolase